ncbi:MAG: HAMP domain-containing sensor histidine kinase [Gemmatimonadaceae bacterium]
MATPEQLERSRIALEAERSRFAALLLFARHVSHDMSNYITVVRTYSELLLADLPTTGSPHADVLEIHRAADAMVDYMQRIGRFARTSTARPGLVQLDETLHNIIKESVAVTRIRINLNSAAAVRIDAVWLADALREVLKNATEASPENSVIEVRTCIETVAAPMIDSGVPIEVGMWALIEVTDSGVGIGLDMRSRALDPFVTTKTAERGAGFGLALARSAVWQAGGQLVIDEPDSTRGGTQVRLWLPLEGAP